MTLDAVLARVARTLKATPEAAPWLEARVIDRIRSESPRRRPALLRWMAVAAAPVGLAVFALLRIGLPSAEPVTSIRFEIRLPEASEVAVVGDFNDWDHSRTPLRHASGRWSVTLPLGSGMYRYAFLIDGERWTADPGRPAPADLDFGEPVSVLTVQ